MSPVPAPQPRLMRIFYRHRAVLVLVPLFFALFAFIALTLLPKRYEAFALVEVTPQSEIISFRPFSQPFLPNDSLVLSEVEIIRSPALIQAVAQELKHPIPFVRDVVDVRVVGRSYIIRISARTSDPAVSRDIVNSLVVAYQKAQVSGKIVHAEKKSNWLNRHLSDLGDKLQKSASQIEDYRQKEGLFDSSKSDILAGQINTLGAQLIQAQAELAALDAKNQTSEQSEAVSAQLDSALINSLSQDETRLKEELAILQQKYGPKHPRLRGARAALSAVQAKRQQDIQRIKNSMTEQKALAEAEIQTLEEQLDDLKDQQQKENKVSISLRELERKDKVNRLLYENILRQSREADLLGDMQQADSRIVSLADLPVTSSNPNRFLVAILSMAVGFLVACFAVILGEQLRQTIDDPAILDSLAPGSSTCFVDFRRPDPDIKTDPSLLPLLYNPPVLMLLIYTDALDRAYTKLYASYLQQQIQQSGRNSRIGDASDLRGRHEHQTVIVALFITDLPKHLGHSAHLVIREGFTSQYHLYLALRSFDVPPEIIYLWT